MSQTATPDPAMPALRAQALRVCLGGRVVIDGLDIALRRGRWTSVVGPNGAGKSTLLRALAGLLPAEGQRELLGRPLAALSARERARSVAWMGQSEQTADDLRAHDAVMLGRLAHQDWLATPTAADHAAVEQALRATQAWDWRERSLGELSGGERQRVLLARTLATQAPVLLMDEPIANLDPPHQADWIARVRGLVAAGHTVVSVLHEMTLALQADDVVVMEQGQVRYNGPADDASAHSAIDRVFGGRVAIHVIDGQRVALPRH